jgi:hypothetical protein
MFLRKEEHTLPLNHIEYIAARESNSNSKSSDNRKTGLSACCFLVGAVAGLLHHCSQQPESVDRRGADRDDSTQANLGGMVAPAYIPTFFAPIIERTDAALYVWSVGVCKAVWFQ